MEKRIKRFYEKEFSGFLKKGKVLVLYGPRQTGKTFLIKEFLAAYSGKKYYGTGDDRPLREIMESEDVRRIKNAFSGYDLVVIDEAQRISNIGAGLKILVDHLPEVKVIASGSSSFELSNKLGEPLTGRQLTAMLYPVAMLELKAQTGGMEVLERLEESLVYGSYPEIVTAPNTGEKTELLISLRDSYLFKDILELENLRNPDKLSALLKMIAFQIGREVSLNELSVSLGMAKYTVERYLDLLEKVFIIRKVSGFSRNLRKEISKTHRYYFLDNGIRNAVINNFNDLGTRNDQGQLWENFLFSERLKKCAYFKMHTHTYFWRTYDKKEIDHIEERDGALYAYEFTFSGKKKKAPALFRETYPGAEYQCVTRENFLDFVT